METEVCVRYVEPIDPGTAVFLGKLYRLTELNSIRRLEGLQHDISQ